jgi:hypothetical protein
VTILFAFIFVLLIKMYIASFQAAAVGLEEDFERRSNHVAETPILVRVPTLPENFPLDIGRQLQPPPVPAPLSASTYDVARRGARAGGRTSPAISDRVTAAEPCILEQINQQRLLMLQDEQRWRQEEKDRRDEEARRRERREEDRAEERRNWQAIITAVAAVASTYLPPPPQNPGCGVNIRAPPKNHGGGNVHGNSNLLLRFYINF